MSQPMKIVQRLGDGAIFAWTALLHKDPNFRAGYLEVKDGKQTVTLDTPEPLVIDNRSQSEMERVLIEENARLKEMLRDLGWDGRMVPVNKHAPDVVAAPLAAGESALPPVAGAVVSADDVPGVPTEIELLPADPAVELPLPDAPVVSTLPTPPVTPPVTGHLSRSKMTQMRNELLIVHAHALKPDVDLPDGATKKVLIEEVLKIQAELSE